MKRIKKMIFENKANFISFRAEKYHNSAIYLGI